jgi:hypothetical protein
LYMNLATDKNIRAPNAIRKTTRGAVLTGR